MNKNTKEKIDDLIDIWIDTARQVEVGWPAASMLSKFIEYRGSFQDTFKPAGLEIYVERQQTQHRKFADIDVALSELDEDKALSIVGKRYFQGLNEQGKTYTNRDRAYEVGQKLKQFENNCAAAYRQLEKTLGLLEKREKYTTYMQ
tara:strand:- start:1050 stop:1487 length:438 start_codon:yes stop_codon:yes gene_type:complete